MAIEARETAGLIGSDKVEGTYVYDAHGQHIGSIERVMIDKRSGQVGLCRAQLWRLSRHRQRLLSDPLVLSRL